MELTSLYDTAPIGLAVLDTRLRFVRVNNRLAEINGRSVEDHIGRSVAEVVPDLAPQAEGVLREILETGEPLRDVEIRGEAPSMPGVERIWVEQFTPIRDERGHIVAISVVAEEVTERRGLQQEVQRMRERLALALGAARVAMWEWHVDSGAVEFAENDWLEPAARMTRSMDDFLQLVHPQDRHWVEQGLQAHLSGQQPRYECEFRLPAEGGGHRWYLSRGQVTERDAAGRPLVMTGVRHDITERKLAEADRRQQASLLDLAFDAIFVWRLDGDIERWNRGAERQYGYTAAEALGRSSHELLRTEFPVPLEQMLAQVRQQGLWRGELVHCTKAGARVRVEAVLQVLPGDPDRVLEIARDMTAEREARDRLAASEHQLREYRERLELALEAGRMGVWEWLPNESHSFWSPEMFALAGLEPAPDARASQDRFMELVHPDDRPVLDGQLARVLDRGGDYQCEFRLRTPGGRERWLLARGRVVQGASDGRARLVGVNLDVTEHKLMEQTLREGDARRNEFLAMLGHELRNPLAPITNAVRLLEKTGHDADRRGAAVQIVKRQSQHMARLVDDLLEVSRITQGRIELRVENLLVATSAYSAIEAARPLACQKQQRIDVSVPPDLDVVADPARLTQILSNLVMNAVKYTPPGGHIRVSAAEVDGQFVEIQVADDGMGISADLLPQVFELFTQDRRTLERSEGGLGLGLALVRRLVELHGGRVRARSPGPGQGSMFTVCLPRRGRRDELRASQIHAETVRVVPLAILIVDDNRDAAETMAALLRLDGHRVSLAFDGPEALEAAQRELPDVVLLDIGLPRMNGFEVARQIRAMPQLAGALVIGMSGYAQSADRAAARAAGFDAHLAKPADLSQVYRTLEQLRGARDIPARPGALAS